MSDPGRPNDESDENDTSDESDASDPERVPDGLDGWIYEHVLDALTRFDEEPRRTLRPYEYACVGDQELLFVIVRRLETEGECILFFTFANLHGDVPDGEREEWEPAGPTTFFTDFREHFEAGGYVYFSAHMLMEPLRGKWAGRALELTEGITSVSLPPERT